MPLVIPKPRYLAKSVQHALSNLYRILSIGDYHSDTRAPDSRPSLLGLRDERALRRASWKTPTTERDPMVLRGADGETEKSWRVVEPADGDCGVAEKFIDLSHGEERTARVDETLRRTRRMLQCLLDDSIEVRLSFCGPAVSLRAAPGQLERHLLHLAFCAREAMPAGGELQILARVLAPDEVSDSSGEHYVRLAVIDTGKCTRNSCPRNQRVPSTVQGFARHLGGWAELASTPGVGTSVRVTLPCSLAHRRC